MKIGIIGYGSMGKMLLWKFSEAGNIGKEDLFHFHCDDLLLCGKFGMGMDADDVEVSV